MERKTLKITLPITGFEVGYYAYITAGEKQQITEIMTSNMTADATGQVKGDIPLSLVYKSNDRAIEMLVACINGSSDNVLEQVKNLPSSDYDVLLEEINKVTSDSAYTQKKTT